MRLPLNPVAPVNSTGAVFMPGGSGDSMGMTSATMRACSGDPAVADPWYQASLPALGQAFKVTGAGLGAGQLA